MKWISVKEQPPPIGEKLFVIKHYLDFWKGKNVPSESMPDIDIAYREYGWEKGGIVTHWMRVEMPDQ